MKISKLQFPKSSPAQAAPEMQEQQGVSRRNVLAALLAGGAIAGVWSSAGAAAVLKKAGASAAANLGLTKLEMTVLGTAAEVIVPATDTPSAREAGVPLFIDALVARWMTADEAASFRSGLAGLDASARQRFGSAGYAACTPEQAAELMQELRAASPYAGRTFSLNDRILDPKAPFYLRLRDLVVLGYFMSEQGSTKELRYIPVPGQFEARLDMKTWPFQTMI